MKIAHTSESDYLADPKAMIVDLSIPGPPSNGLFVFSSKMLQVAGEASSFAGHENAKLLVRSSNSIILNGEQKVNEDGHEIK